MAINNGKHCVCVCVGGGGGGGGAGHYNQCATIEN